MGAQNEKKFLALKYYFSTTSLRCNRYSYFFLLGYRKKVIFLRVRGLIHTIKKLNIFLKICHLRGAELWLCCGQARYVRLMRWAVEAGGLNYILKTPKSGLLFFWRNRFFRTKSRFFNRHLAKFLRIDLLIFLRPSAADKILVELIRNNTPTIVIRGVYDITPPSDFSFICSERSHALLFFYLRLLLVLGQRLL